MFFKPTCCSLILGTLALLSGERDSLAQAPSVGNCLFQNHGKNIIIMPGSTSLIPVVQYLGSQLQKMSNPYLLVYFPMSSCDAMVRVNRNDPVTGTGQIYSEVNGQIVTSSCSIDGQVPLDLAIGDTFYETCDATSARVETLGDFQGPQQAFVFIVPRSNLGVLSISAEEARDVFGCGAKGKVSPFFDDNYIQSYKNGADVRFGAQLITGKVINLSYFIDNNSAVNHTRLGDQDDADAVATSTSPEKTIGFISAEIYDQMRDKLKALAFRGLRQQYAYLPDTNSNSRDRRNLRDGHYTNQAPMHMWAKLNPDGTFVRPLAKKLVDWMQDNPVPAEDKLPVSINEVYAKAGVVPKCAMKVKRTVDGGPFSPYVPEKAACGCSFEAAATGVALPPGCVACKDKSTCASGQVCSYGFCELAW